MTNLNTHTTYDLLGFIPCPPSYSERAKIAQKPSMKWSDRVAKAIKLRNQIGEWAFVRALRNAGLTFETTYYLTFGRQPRRF